MTAGPPSLDLVACLRRGLQTWAFCLAISSLQMFVEPNKRYAVELTYSLCIGTTCWLLAEVFRHPLRRPGDPGGWPHDWRGAVLFGISIGGGFLAGTALADAWFGWSSWSGYSQLKRSVALTPAGRVLVDEARRLLAAMDTLPAQVQRAARGDTGVLRAGTISTALFSVARTFEAAMRKALPSVRLAWQVQSSAQQVDELRHNRLDLAFVHTPIEHEGLALRRVLREALVVALPATHPAARQRTVTLRALKDETFIVADRDRVPSYYDRFIAACHVAGFEPRLFHQRQTMVNFLGLVAIGAGVTVVPVSLTRVQVAGVAYVKLAGTGPFSELSVAWNPATQRWETKQHFPSANGWNNTTKSYTP